MNDGVCDRTRRAFARATATAAIAGIAGCRGGDTATVSYPDGWSEDGLIDPDAVRRSHRSVLDARSYEYRLESVSADGRSDQTNEYVGRVDPTERVAVVRHQTVYDRTDPDERRVRDTHRYVADGQTYLKRSGAGVENSYEIEDSGFDDERYVAGIWPWIELFRYTQRGREGSGDTGQLRYTAEELVPDAAEGLGDGWREAIASGVSADLGVRSDGLLTSADLTIGTVGETATFIDLTWSVDGVGTTTVAEPEWVEQVRSER